MVEKVETGGVMSFNYSSKERTKLSGEKKKEIEEAYGKYYKRKSREKRNRIMKWGIVISLLLIVLVYFLFFRG